MNYIAELDNCNFELDLAKRSLALYKEAPNNEYETHIRCELVALLMIEISLLKTKIRTIKKIKSNYGYNV